MASQQASPSDQKPDSLFASKLTESELASASNVKDELSHSPSSGYKSFAVAGLRGLVSFVLEELAAVQGTRVAALDESSPKEEVDEGDVRSHVGTLDRGGGGGGGGGGTASIAETHDEEQGQVGGPLNEDNEQWEEDFEGDQWEPPVRNNWGRLRYALREPFAEFLGMLVLIVLGVGADCQVKISQTTAGDSSSVNWTWGFGLTNVGYTVNYGNIEQLVEALKGVEVVVSTLSGEALGEPQLNLAKAAKKAGVLLYVPSEFGLTTHGLPNESPLFPKTNFQSTLKSLQLDHLVLYSYIFPDVVCQPVFGVDFKDGKIEIIASGDMLFPQTSHKDVARFLAHILTRLSPVLLINKTFVIQAEAVHPKSEVTIKYVSVKDAEAELKPDDLATYLRVEWAELESPKELVYAL